MYIQSDDRICVKRNFKALRIIEYICEAAVLAAFSHVFVRWCRKIQNCRVKWEKELHLQRHCKKG